MLVAWLLVGSAGLMAQGSITPEQAARIALEVSGDGPPVTAGYAPSQVEVEASESGGKALLVWHGLPGNFGLRISTPVDNSDEVTEFVNQDGLANQLSGSLTWDRVFAGLKAQDENPDAREIYKSVQSLCEKVGLESDKCVDDHNYQKALARLRGSHRKDIEDFIRQAVNGPAVWSTGFELKVGHKSFDFFDLDGEALDRDRISGSLTWSVAKNYAFKRYLFSITYEEAYHDARLRGERCSAIDGSTELESCKTLPVGAPPRQDAFKARFEWRQSLSGGNLGIAPLLSYDLEEDILGVELPVYVLTDPDDKLTGGFQLQWSTETDLGGSVFLGRKLF